jgi:hypothetical protein
MLMYNGFGLCLTANVFTVWPDYKSTNFKFIPQGQAGRKSAGVDRDSELTWLVHSMQVI